MNICPVELVGNWANGWALDLHTVKSVLHVDDHGDEYFDTTRTELGEALYLLKYRGQRYRTKGIAQTAAEFARSVPQLTGIRAIIPVPPSNLVRWFQPVPVLATAIGELLGIQAPLDYLVKIRQTTTLKDEFDIQRRHEQLEGAFKAADQRYAGAHVLAFDDMYRSGETLSAVCATLLNEGRVASVSALTLTKTRSKR